jgi:putative Holliday junction resolvase
LSIIALDIGLKRIGLAVSQNGTFATPLKAIERRNRKQASREVDEVLKKWECKTLVVGLPNGGNGDEMFRRFSHFVSLLSFSEKVIYFDEDFSSFEAKEMMKGEIREKRDGRIDSLSAKIVLDRYLLENQ